MPISPLPLLTPSLSLLFAFPTCKVGKMQSIFVVPIKRGTSMCEHQGVVATRGVSVLGRQAELSSTAWWVH